MILDRKNYRIVTDSFSGHSKFRTHSQVSVYTDGSKTEAGVGSGTALYQGLQVTEQKSGTLPRNATVFMAEIAAIRMGAQMVNVLLEHKQVKYVKFLVDSRAALQALDNRKIQSLNVLDTANELNALANKGVTISLVWIKAHASYEGNELADDLAKKGAEGTDSINIQMRRPWQDLKQEVRTGCAEQWKKEWDVYPHARQTKQFFPAPDSKKACELLGLDRRDLTRLTGIITGHGVLGYHQSLINPEIDPKCRFCSQDNETAFHMLTSCPLFIHCRAECMGWYVVQNISRWTVAGLLKFIKITPLLDILQQEERAQDVSSSIEIPE